MHPVSVGRGKGDGYRGPIELHPTSIQSFISDAGGSIADYTKTLQWSGLETKPSLIRDAAMVAFATGPGYLPPCIYLATYRLHVALGMS